MEVSLGEVAEWSSACSVCPQTWSIRVVYPCITWLLPGLCLCSLPESFSSRYSDLGLYTVSSTQPGCVLTSLDSKKVTPLGEWGVDTHWLIESTVWLWCLGKYRKKFTDWWTKHVNGVTLSHPDVRSDCPHANTRPLTRWPRLKGLRIGNTISALGTARLRDSTRHISAAYSHNQLAWSLQEHYQTEEHVENKAASGYIF